MLKEINKARQRYREFTGDTPRDLAISYDDGLCLLIESSKSIQSPEIEDMLLRGNRAEIKAHLNGATVYGMELIVVDMVVGRG